MIPSSKNPQINDKIYIAPSILSADLAHLEAQIKQVEEAGADVLHVDIMDGHFVPNLSFGPSIVGSLKKITNLPLDVHLMVEHPLNFLETFATKGADIITVHLEAKSDIKASLTRIRELGIKAGLSIKPKTRASEILPFINLLDLVLVMSVEPGFGGQQFLPSSASQIAEVKQIINQADHAILLEVDGGINMQTAPLATRAGANMLVAGNAIFSASDPVSALKQIRQVASDI